MVKKDNSDANRNFFIDEVIVLSGSKGDFIFDYMVDYFGETIKTLKESEAQLKEVNRIITSFGADKRESINSSLLSSIKKHLKDGSLKHIIPIESEGEEKKLTYKVSGSKLVKKPLETGLYVFSPRSELNALVIVRRHDEKDKLLDESVDILEYKDGNLITLISGGIGETKINDLGDMAKQVGIVISAGPQLTKREMKDREKAAAFHIHEAFQDSKKKKKEEDLLERIKSGAEEKIDKGEVAVEKGKIINLEEAPERIQELHPEKSKKN